MFQIPFLIKNEDDAITAGSTQLDSSAVPIFCVSSVSGEGLELLKKFLFVLPPKMSNKEREKLEQVRTFLIKIKLESRMESNY